MPTYQYRCTACDHRFDAVQSFSDPSLTTCPECSGRLRKVFSSVGIVFKGSGFYRTDSRSGSGSAVTSDSGSKNGASSESGSKESVSSNDSGSKGSGSKDSAKTSGNGDGTGSAKKEPAASGSSTSSTPAKAAS